MANLFECAVYLIGMADESHIKIGVSMNPNYRLKALQTAHPDTLKLLHSFWFGSKDMALRVERETHLVMSYCGKAGEWFVCSKYEAQLAVIDVCLRLRLLGVAIDLHRLGITAETFDQIFSTDAERARARRWEF